MLDGTCSLRVVCQPWVVVRMAVMFFLLAGCPAIALRRLLVSFWGRPVVRGRRLRNCTGGPLWRRLPVHRPRALLEEVKQAAATVLLPA